MRLGGNLTTIRLLFLNPNGPYISVRGDFPVTFQYKICHHGLATQSVSAPRCRIDEKGGGQNLWKTGFRVAPTRGRRVMSIADNPESVSSLSCSIRHM